MLTYGETLQVAIASNLNALVLERIDRVAKRTAVHVLSHMDSTDRDVLKLLDGIAEQLLVAKSLVIAVMDDYEAAMEEHLTAHPENEELLIAELAKHPTLDKLQEELLKSPTDRLAELITRTKMA